MTNFMWLPFVLKISWTSEIVDSCICCLSAVVSFILFYENLASFINELHCDSASTRLSNHRFQLEPEEGFLICALQSFDGAHLTILKCKGQLHHVMIFTFGLVSSKRAVLVFTSRCASHERTYLLTHYALGKLADARHLLYGLQEKKTVAVWRPKHTCYSRVSVLPYAFVVDRMQHGWLFVMLVYNSSVKLCSIPLKLLAERRSA